MVIQKDRVEPDQSSHLLNVHWNVILTPQKVSRLSCYHVILQMFLTNRQTFKTYKEAFLVKS